MSPLSPVIDSRIASTAISDSSGRSSVRTVSATFTGNKYLSQKLRHDNDRLANELAVALGQLRDLRRGLLAAYLSRHGSMINGNAIS